MASPMSTSRNQTRRPPRRGQRGSRLQELKCPTCGEKLLPLGDTGKFVCERCHEVRGH